MDSEPDVPSDCCIVIVQINLMDGGLADRGTDMS